MDRKEFFRKFGAALAASSITPTLLIGGKAVEKSEDDDLFDVTIDDKELDDIIKKYESEFAHHVFEILETIPNQGRGNHVKIPVLPHNLSYFHCGDSVQFDTGTTALVISIDGMNNELTVTPFLVSSTIGKLKKNSLFFVYESHYPANSSTP